MPTPTPLPVVLALTALIDGLLEAVAARYGVFPIRGPVLLFLWKRFSRVKRRFAALAARLAAGRGFSARPPRPRAARASRPARDNNAFRIRRWVNPTFGWLCRVAPGSIGAPAFASALRALLETDADMRALLAATPSTARALRPLCWMLGVKPPPVVLTASPGVAPAEPAPGHDAARAGPIAAIPRTFLAPASVPPRAAPPPPDPPDAFFRAA